MIDGNSDDREFLGESFKEAFGDGSVIDPYQGCNDYSNAERLARRVAGRAFYVPGLGWFCWDRCRYILDEAWMYQQEAANARALFGEAPKFADERERKLVCAHANTSMKKERLTAAIVLAATIPGMRRDAQSLDRNPDLLGVQNGILDLARGELVHQQSETPYTGDFVTKQAGCAWDADAQCPTWSRFLLEVFGGDRELVDYIQRAVGYSLSGSVVEHALFFLYGSGANGKSVFTSILKILFGDYGAVINSDALMQKTHDQQSNDLARLTGKRMVSAPEVADGKRWDEVEIKTLTGGDPVSARFLYREFFEFRPVFKLWVVGNHRPSVSGTDEGIWRRMQLIPFNVFFTAEKRDRHIESKLQIELPGILRWAVEGYREWKRHGLRPPGKVLDATADYREEEDRVGQFLEECCEVSPDLTVGATELHAAYMAWARRRGETPLNQKNFGHRLLGRPGITRRKSGRVVYDGLWVKADSRPHKADK